MVLRNYNCKNKEVSIIDGLLVYPLKRDINKFLAYLSEGVKN
jgi:hypothetical protein